MGYFSNGTELEFYIEGYCVHCAHCRPDDEDHLCPILGLHLDYNYERGNLIEKVLNELIPRAAIGNGNCAMFIEPNDGRCQVTGDLFETPEE